MNKQTAMKITILTLGSRGDTQPYLALAVGFSTVFAAIERAAFTYPMSR